VTTRAWTVRAGDGATVEAIVARVAPGDPRAIREGRVFVGRRRALAPNEPVQVGDEVTVAEGSAAGNVSEAGAVATILARGDGWVAVDKPAGIPTIPDQGGASHALIALAARALSLEPAQLHATSRLDREVSGVVVFALAREAAAHLRHLRDEHEYVRRYLAIAVRAPAVAEGTWSVPIGRARDPRHRAPNGRDAVAAETHFAVVARAGPFALLALAPVTGRTHQLRVHASHAGAPLLGDRAYGAPPRVTLSSGRVFAFDRIALHAARVTLGTVATVAIDSPVPEKLRAAWLALGGDDAAWEKALTWHLAAESA
jgi:23S rRNA pseudouridine1911/1915/1917 synthase